MPKISLASSQPAPPYIRYFQIVREVLEESIGALVSGSGKSRKEVCEAIRTQPTVATRMVANCTHDSTVSLADRCPSARKRRWPRSAADALTVSHPDVGKEETECQQFQPVA